MGGWEGGTTSSPRLVSSQWEWASVPGAYWDLEFEAQVHTLFPCCSFCSILKSRIENNELEDTALFSNQGSECSKEHFSFQKVFGEWDFFFFHGLAPYSHLDVKRCDENEVKVLTCCLGFLLFPAIKDQPWLYIMCPYFGVSAIKYIIQ